MKPGEKIKLQREDKKLDLKEVARRTQLDEGHLMKIESGEVAPALGTLIKLARVFGVRLGTFLDDQEKRGAVVTREGDNDPVGNMNASGSQSSQNLAFLSLAREKADRHMEPFLIEVLPDESGEHKFSAHEGEEFIYVLEGTVEIAYGQESHVLNTRDSVYYDSIVEHRVKAVDGQKALVLAVVYLPV